MSFFGAGKHRLSKGNCAGRRMETRGTKAKSELTDVWRVREIEMRIICVPHLQVQDSKPVSLDLDAVLEHDVGVAVLVGHIFGIM